jgi:serine/threonine-protein kinase
MQVLDQEPVAPRLLNPQVDRELELVCLKCLQKPADLRYPTAAALANDLQAYLQGVLASIWPGGIGHVLNRMLRETHHAPILENWGVLWMWHSLKILLMCVLTAIMYRSGIDSHFPYLILWTVGLFAWGCIFWHLRKRGGPVTFVERQIAHIWAAGIVGSISIFIAEWVHGMPVLSMAPGLAVLASLAFLIKAGILSGSFYFAFAAMFLTSSVMALLPHQPEVQVLLFGAMSGVCFFVPGLKYYRQKLRSGRGEAQR